MQFELPSFSLCVSKEVAERSHWTMCNPEHGAWIRHYVEPVVPRRMLVVKIQLCSFESICPRHGRCQLKIDVAPVYIIPGPKKKPHRLGSQLDMSRIAKEFHLGNCRAAQDHMLQENTWAGEKKT